MPTSTKAMFPSWESVFNHSRTSWTDAYAESLHMRLSYSWTQDGLAEVKTLHCTRCETKVGQVLMQQYKAMSLEDLLHWIRESRHAHEQNNENCFLARLAGE